MPPSPRAFVSSFPSQCERCLPIVRFQPSYIPDKKIRFQPSCIPDENLVSSLLAFLIKKIRQLPGKNRLVRKKDRLLTPKPPLARLAAGAKKTPDFCAVTSRPRPP
jgi:hypothetical protein